MFSNKSPKLTLSYKPVGIGASALATGYLVVVMIGTPDVSALRTKNPVTTSYRREWSKNHGRQPAIGIAWTPIDQISPILICSVIKAEDRNFFRHGGIDWHATSLAAKKAFYVLVRGGRITGASTITQQLARNLYLSSKRSFHRKIMEGFIANRLEANLSKRRILELYLNTIEYGDGVWGITAAGAHYFGVLPGNLDPFEATVLASVLSSARQPFDANTIELRGRIQRRVIWQLYRAGFLNHYEATHLVDGANQFKAALTSGIDVYHALDVMRMRTQEIRTEISTKGQLAEPNVDGVIANECGIDREVRIESVARARMNSKG